MTDVTQGQDAPYRLAGPEAMDQWRQGTPQPPQPGAPSLAPQSPLSAVGPPPTPTAGPPPGGNINYPPIPQVPKQQQFKEPPPDAKEYQKDAMEWASAFAVLGALAGRFTRAPGGAALAAFGEAVKGWQTGNLGAYQQAADKWEKQSKLAIENNKQVLEDYRLTIENYKLNIDQQMSELNLKSAKWHDQQMYDFTRAQNWTMSMQIYEKGVEWTQKAEDRTNTLAEKKQKEQESAPYWLSPAGQAELNAVNPDGAPKYSLAQKGSIDQLIEGYLTKQGAGKIDPTMVEQLARQDLAGDQSWKTNVGRGAQGGAMLRAVASRKAAIMAEENISPEDVARHNQEYKARQAGASSEERAVGQRAGGIAVAVQEAHDTVPNVLAAAEQSAGKGLAVWNAVENKWNVQKGDANYAYYVQQLNSLINVYGRVISGGGKGTVSDLEHAREMLNANMPLSAVKGALRGFTKEIDIAEKAPEKVRARMHGGKETPAQTTDAPAGAAGGSTATDPTKMSDDDLKKQLGL